MPRPITRSIFIPSNSVTIDSIDSKEMVSIGTQTDSKHVTFHESVEYIKEKKGIKIVPKKKGIKIVPKQTHYSPNDIDTMDDSTLAREFIRLTGTKTLYCTHCKGESPIEIKWMNSIRKRCMKPHGLFKDMPLPKTCDKQQAKNQICNSINNPVYQKLRNKSTTQQEQEMAIQQRIEGIRQIGIQPNPHKYKL